jgi:hypothetical protein
MPDGDTALTARTLERIAEIDAVDWDACAGDGNPFIGHAFLDCLEESGSVAARTGWQPQHLVVEDAAGTILAVCPLYLKGHSQGEYIFDYAWAHAYENAGGRYYPKLLSAVPFTPVPGPRLLVRPGTRAAQAREALIAALGEVTRRYGVSSLHVNFCTEEEYEQLGEHGFLQRLGHQYHWHNDGYADFDAFLAALASRKRKAIRKERRDVAESGVEIATLTGAAIEPRHWDAFYAFYMDTGSRKWGSPYLNREFFHLLGERLADKVVLVYGESEGQPVCGALNLRGADALYGRNWGCLEHYRFLHFEACYYRAIDFAIEHGLDRVEAGAQGEHKIQRGYLPVPTYSAHLIPDPGFRRAVDDYLESERHHVEYEIAALGEHSPFRKAD